MADQYQSRKRKRVIDVEEISEILLQEPTDYRVAFEMLRDKVLGTTEGIKKKLKKVTNLVCIYWLLLICGSLRHRVWMI